jgi:hypothetical protein
MTDQRFHGVSIGTRSCGVNTLLASICNFCVANEQPITRRSHARVWFRVFYLLAAAGFSVVAHAQPIVAVAASYTTRGNPTTAIPAPDGRYVFVSVTNVDSPNFAGPDVAAGRRSNVISGIEVFRSVGWHNKLKPIAFVRIGGKGANGMTLLHGGRTLVVGVGDDGVAFLSVDDLKSGRGAPLLASQGDGAGTFDVVATPDGRYVFSSNEYGLIQGQRGNVGVIATHINANGRVTHPQTLGQIPTGDVVPSLALSPDGSRLYVASELVPATQPPPIAGADNPQLTKHDCVQRQGSPPRWNGFITVLDVAKALSLDHDAVLSRVASGCSPVRIDESADQSALYVSARGDNVILVFSPHRLESDPDHAMLRVLPTGGTAPVGVHLFGADRYLAVADSNRFASGSGTLAILSASGSPGTPPLQVLQERSFPRNISRSADGSTLYLTNYNSRTLEVIRVRSGSGRT